VFGGMLGVPPVTSYVESAAGVAAGGRTGLTAVVVGVLFVAAMFFAPLAGSVPAFATAPALLFVAVLMASGLAEIDWEDITVAAPVVVTALAMPFTLVGSLGGLALVLIATFGRKQDNPAIVLSYAALEGLFLGAISFVLANFRVSGASAGALIGQAILGTVGVFFGMLVVYKTGAIRVTPKFTRMLVAAMIGALVLMLGNFLISMFSTHDGGPLRNGGTMAIIFSLVMIVIAAFSFLLDFDSADQMIRAGAPEKAAWGIALGLTVTLVWLYLEILRLLTYFQND
jgi:uncharacterized YccA/Bax inhibitor family protein